LFGCEAASAACSTGHIYTHTYTHTYTHIHTHTHTYTHKHTHKSKPLRTCPCTHYSTGENMDLHAFQNVCVRMSVCTCVYLCVYVCMRVCVRGCVHGALGKLSNIFLHIHCFKACILKSFGKIPHIIQILFKQASCLKTTCTLQHIEQQIPCLCVCVYVCVWCLFVCVTYFADLQIWPTLIPCNKKTLYILINHIII
jgi:hypothetical protein